MKPTHITNPMPLPGDSPAADRNKQPILDVLCHILPTHGRALEIASGTGQHMAWFAAHMPQWTWQPTDAQPQALEAITTRLAAQPLANVCAPLMLDVLAPQWLAGDETADQKTFDLKLFDLIYCANMLHISPWETCAALMQGSARYLAPSGRLVTYGPYLEDDVITSDSNLAFDHSLRARNADWGIRRRQDVETTAVVAGLRLVQRHALPANNLLLVWCRQ